MKEVLTEEDLFKHIKFLENNFDFPKDDNLITEEILINFILKYDKEKNMIALFEFMFIKLLQYSIKENDKIDIELYKKLILICRNLNKNIRKEKIKKLLYGN